MIAGNRLQTGPASQATTCGCGLLFRIDKARARELGDSGLGLAIVKHIVQAHGGTLRFESEVGRGSTVRVVLPRRRRTLPRA
jgi:signal transduction histidine kinase